MKEKNIFKKTRDYLNSEPTDQQRNIAFLVCVVMMAIPIVCKAIEIVSYLMKSDH